MERIGSDGFEAVRPALHAMSQHLPVAAVLAGRVPGMVWANNSAEPTVVVVQCKARCFIAGGERPGEAAMVAALFAEVVLPGAQRAGRMGVVAHASDAAWNAGLDAALKDLLPETGKREYYDHVTPAAAPAAQVPEGFALRAADAELLADTRLSGRAELREEMRSERESVEAFLAESFGVCAVQGDTVAGWCLSEYNLGERCEVGIGTAAPYRRHGLALAMTQRLLAMAAARGVREVGWHCWAHNTASAATARKAGFSRRAEETVRMRWWR